MWGSHQPQPARAALRGSALQQKDRRGDPQRSSLQDSPRSPVSYERSPQAVGVDLTADRRAGVGRRELPRQRSSETAGPSSDRRSAPQGQDPWASASPNSGSYLPGSERSETNRNQESALKGRPVPGAAKDPGAQAGHPPQRMISRLWSWNKDAGSSSKSGSQSGSASHKDSSEKKHHKEKKSGKHSSKHLEQGKGEARTSLIPETHKALTTTNQLEAELEALRNSSHPQSLEFLQSLGRPFQIVTDLLAENQRLQTEALQVRSLQAEVKQLQQMLQKRQVSQRVPEHPLVAENQRLRQELQELKDSHGVLLSNLQAVLSSMEAENQELRQELQELQRGQVPKSETTADKMPVPQIIAFPVQVRVSGETRGYEKQFLGDVAKVLVGHKVSLQVKEYEEDSGHLLVLFLPIALRAGTDIDNALNGFKSMQKILLVVLHYKAKDKPFVADKAQVQHPALVATVHACYSIEDGFYHCQANEDAVASLAAAIVQLTRES